jgi:hypothetical protein
VAAIVRWGLNDPMAPCLVRRRCRERAEKNRNGLKALCLRAMQSIVILTVRPYVVRGFPGGDNFMRSPLTTDETGCGQEPPKQFAKSCSLMCWNLTSPNGQIVRPTFSRPAALALTSSSLPPIPTAPAATSAIFGSYTRRMKRFWLAERIFNPDFVNRVSHFAASAS